MAGFRFCLNTATVQGQNLGIERIVELAGETGWHGVEPWIGELDAYVASGGKLHELGKKIADLGMKVEGAIGFFEWVVNDPAVRAKGFAEARRNFAMMAEIGGTRIAAPAFGAHQTLAGGEKPIELLAMAERYAHLLALGKQFGVTPLVEVWGFSPTLSRLGEAVLVAVESGDESAAILADSYHLYRGGSDYRGLALLSPRALPLFHVNDYPPIAPAHLKDEDRIWPGDGAAPLKAILNTLQDMGFDGALSLELFNAAYWKMDPKDALRTGLAKLKDVLASND